MLTILTGILVATKPRGIVHNPSPTLTSIPIQEILIILILIIDTNNYDNKNCYKDIYNNCNNNIKNALSFLLLML